MKFKKLVKSEEEIKDTNKRKTKIEEWLESIDDELYYIKGMIKSNVEAHPNRGDIKSAITKKLQDAYSSLLDIEDLF